MMKKNGFTLVELLVVISIIAILSVVVIPSVIKVNKNVNERLYGQKVENIEAAAEMYASDNPDIFNGADRVYVYVYQLIDASYLKADTKTGDGDCKAAADKSDESAFKNGCIVDPRNDTESAILNKEKVLLVKKNVGVTASLINDGSAGTSSGSATLVQMVCDRFNSGAYVGMYSADSTDTCKCKDDYSDIVKGDGSALSADACMIVSNSPSGDVDNWLKYGSTQANWRVLGLYRINGKLYPKIITSDVVQ